MSGPGRRRTFGPVVLLGVAGSGLAAFGGSRPWASAAGSGEGDATGALASTALASGTGEVPLAGALALVSLACWGVVLVARGRLRRVPAGLAVLAAAGVLVTVAAGVGSVRQDVRNTLVGLGATQADVGFTASVWVCALGALLALAAAVLAVRWAPAWPEMGRRYDAPGAAPATPAARGEDGGDADNLELWRSLDQGRDPTA